MGHIAIATLNVFCAYSDINWIEIISGQLKVRKWNAERAQLQTKIDKSSLLFLDGLR